MGGGEEGSHRGDAGRAGKVDIEKMGESYEWERGDGLKEEGEWRGELAGKNWPLSKES